MTTRRLRPIREAQRRRILKRDNHTCVYCFELATECDHIIPYSYIPDNTDANLVASCGECNRLASNMVFPSFIMKYQYIKREREKRTRPQNPEWYYKAVRDMMDEVPELAKVIKLPKPKVIKLPRVRVARPLKESIVKPPVPRPLEETVPVTDALRGHITNLRNGQTWRALRDELPGWKWSHALLADIATGKVFSTSLAVYEALGIMPPTLIIAGPGSIIIGSGQGLLSPDQPAVYIVMPPEEWERHSMKCQACGETTTRWNPAQRYCNIECRQRARRERKAKKEHI